MTVPIDKADFVDLLERAAWAFDDADWEWFLKGLSPPVQRRMFEEFFHWQAHGGQAEPPGEWRVWFLRAGRGFGKTMAGAHWVLERARTHPGARIALVGGSFDEVRKVMIEGPGGLIAQARSGEPVEWNPTQAIVRFHSGAWGSSIRPGRRRNCAGRSIISPGATSSPNGRTRATWPGTICRWG